jgi:hypothetical protein
VKALEADDCKVSSRSGCLGCGMTMWKSEQVVLTTTTQNCSSG